MKYAIITCINGNYKIEAEGITNLANAKVNFHNKCQVLWNAPDVITGYVMIADENLDKVERYGEYIWHDAPEPESEPEVVEEPADAEE